MAKKVHSAAKHIDFVLFDILALIISFVAAYFIRIDRADDAEYFEMYRDMGILILVIYLVIVAFSSTHSNILKRTALREAWEIGILNAEIISVVFAILFASKSTVVYSRILFAVFIALDCGLMFMFRTLRKLFILSQYRNGVGTSKVLVVTYEKTADKIIEALRSQNTGYYEFKGIIIEGESTESEICRIPVLKMEGILDYIKENAINEVFIFLRHGESGKLMSKFMIMGLTVHVGLDLELRNLSNVTIDQLANYTIVTSTISRATVGELFVKRAFDIFVGIIGLIITAITFIFVAPIIKIQSPGPVFFVQKRVGKNGRVFNMIKFRSMVVQDEEEEKSAWTTKEDPRITKFGHFIRSTSIDELPQLFNVLIGDMSLVGPRPERPYFVEKFQEEIPRYMIKHQVRPGMTGWAQINGFRGDTSIKKRIEYDLYYIENWTMWLDFKILFLTIFRGFVNKNAY